MIKVVVCCNTGKQEVMIEREATPRQAFEQAGVNYASGMTTIDGATLGPGNIDKTFADLGIADKSYLVVASKHDNA